MEVADAIMRRCGDEIADSPMIEGAETFANENERAIESSRVRGVSAKYDPSIVFAIDETLTRGTYAVLAKWFVSYANVSDLPGCVVVVGYERGSVGRCASDRDAPKRQRRSFDHSENDDAFVDLGCSENGPSNGRVPLVLLNASLEYPIFEFKRCTGYPIVTVLVTLRSSRLAYALSCDGRIDVDPRDSVQRSFRKIVDAVGYVAERYLKDFYYDETRSLSRRFAVERCEASERDDAKKTRSDVRDDFSIDREAERVERRFENFMKTNNDEDDDDDDAATTTPSEYSENSEICDEFAERTVAPYDSTRYSVLRASVEENVDENAISMDEMRTRNQRILRQMRDADRALRAESLYPSGTNDRIAVVRETS